MRFPEGYAGVKKLFTSEILNFIAAMIILPASVVMVIAGKKYTDPETLPFVVIPFLVSGIIGIVAFIIQIVGLNRARKDDSQFKTALIFVFAGIAATFVASLTGGMFGNIFSFIDEVATLLVSVYTILGIYDLAEELENENVMLHGKIALFSGASVFVTAVFFRMIPVFVPRTNDILDILSLVMESAGYLIFVIFIFKAKKMLSATAK